MLESARIRIVVAKNDTNIMIDYAWRFCSGALCRDSVANNTKSIPHAYIFVPHRLYRRDLSLILTAIPIQV